VVESIDKKHAILNANHELAGIPLVASGKILEIEQLSDKAAEELLHAEHHH
jgi:FKBP-type peptidyl-prolyl cis-trans isomerase 2